MIELKNSESRKMFVLCDEYTMMTCVNNNTKLVIDYWSIVLMYCMLKVTHKQSVVLRSLR